MKMPIAHFHKRVIVQRTASEPQMRAWKLTLARWAGNNTYVLVQVVRDSCHAIREKFLRYGEHKQFIGNGHRIGTPHFLRVPQERPMYHSTI
jgi:hypothetical protein